jgi:hypothetical protein
MSFSTSCYPPQSFVCNNSGQKVSRNNTVAQTKVVSLTLWNERDMDLAGNCDFFDSNWAASADKPEAIASEQDGGLIPLTRDFLPPSESGNDFHDAHDDT